MCADCSSDLLQCETQASCANIAMATAQLPAKLPGAREIIHSMNLWLPCQVADVPVTSLPLARKYLQLGLPARLDWTELQIFIIARSVTESITE